MQQRDQYASPLPPDPAGREDIMSPEPGEEAITGTREGSPLPGQDGPPDVRRDEARDGSAA